ncbi:putative nucleic acid-binding protein [Paraburkholderia sp. Clong3]|uniref:hypothetical protein n=1 Tax=Paraburkholderia sp. Clong3 TaxID=2991061 RepID=UPI003D260D5E
MKKIYFDTNVLSYLRSGSNLELNARFAQFSSNDIVVFSPAHLEDIAASAMRDNTDAKMIDEEIEFLHKIAKRHALRPVTRDDVVLYDEAPQDCYARVIDQYGKNDDAEEIESAVVADANRNPAGAPREMNNIAPEDILTPIVYRELIALRLSSKGYIDESEEVGSLRWTFADLKGRFSVFEAYVNLSANILEKLGYYREKEDKYRARLHDVSHIIYGAYCDVFVSADKKLVKKAKAIYSLLGVPVEVIELSDFCRA